MKRVKMAVTQQSITCSLDWLQFSAPYPSEWNTQTWKQDAIELQEQIRVLATQYVPMSIGTRQREPQQMNWLSGYTHVENFNYAHVFVAPNDMRQKVAVRSTGQELAHWRTMGNTDERFLAHCYQIGGSPSRIDIAFDCRGFGIEPLRMYADWKAKKFTTRAKTVHPYSKGVMQPNGTIEESTTLYIGSRESSTFIRVYEKGKQVGDGTDWVRIEIEVKGEQAKNILKDVMEFGLASVGISILKRSFKTCPYRFWSHLLKFGVVPLTPTKRKITDSEAWVLSTALPALWRELMKDISEGGSGVVTEAFEKMKSDYRRELAQATRETVQQ